LIEDFPEDVPVSGRQVAPLACPVSFKNKEESLSDDQQLTAALKAEIAGMRNWYDLAVKKRGRTTVGVSKMEIDKIGDFIGEFIMGNTPENPRSDISFPYAVNLLVDDLKAYYYEALTAQPGQASLSSEALNNWFWKETAASRALFALRDRCNQSEDNLLKLVGNMMLIPVDFAFG